MVTTYVLNVNDLPLLRVQKNRLRYTRSQYWTNRQLPPPHHYYAISARASRRATKKKSVGEQSAVIIMTSLVLQATTYNNNFETVFMLKLGHDSLL